MTEDNLTDLVLERWNDIPDPRLRQIMQSLIKHLHGFLRDVSPDAGGMGDRDRVADSNRPNVLDQGAINHSCYFSKTQPQRDIPRLGAAL